MAADDEELLHRLGDALAPEDRPLDDARVAALRAAATARQEELADGSRPSERSRRALAPLAVAAAVLAALAIGALVTRDDPTQEPAGTVEFEATMRAADGDATATVIGLRTGIGRIVELRTATLPILPKGQYYEVWFVGPGDTPDAPNRISAGTFHPDERGRTDIELTAAVDPTKYPSLSVTSEPGDGDPSPSGVEVLRAAIEVTG